VDAELALLNEVSESAYQLADFTRADVTRARQIAEQHRDLAIGLADTSLAVLSKRTGVLDLLTLDRRHFRTIPGAGGKPFRLLPADA
jgi:predicted nucleic acid-binding protein